MIFEVTAKRLNKRKWIPRTLPESEGIIAIVNQGNRFEATEASPSEIPNASLGKWYKDLDGYFYWGGGVVEFRDIITVALKQEKISWWIKSFGIEEIWNKYNEKGSRAKVAIIDTGYNVNNSEIANGVVGTYLHPSLLGHTTLNDNDGHGTYCATIIGGRNQLNVIGCAPECQLYISKMSETNSYGKKNIVDAIEDAIKNDVDIISISNGGIKFEELELVVQKAISKNIIVVAAIGNNISVSIPHNGGDYPALYAGCIAVGATDKSNKLDIITLINDKTEINGPGEDIYGYIKNNFPEKFNTSTSSATAIVAGICALIISRLKKLEKQYTALSIKKLISENCEPVVNNPSQKLISPSKIFLQI
jgi:subtilisin family serine protease